MENSPAAITSHGHASRLALILSRRGGVTPNTSAPTLSYIPGAPARVDWVDYAKGLCIVLVVMMHVTLRYGAEAGREGWMHHVVLFAQPFRMPDFFLISGLFLSHSLNKPWREYLDRKVLHFVYFYVLWLVIKRDREEKAAARAADAPASPKPKATPPPKAVRAPQPAARVSRPVMPPPVVAPAQIAPTPAGSEPTFLR